MCSFSCVFVCVRGWEEGQSGTSRGGSRGGKQGMEFSLSVCMCVCERERGGDMRERLHATEAELHPHTAHFGHALTLMTCGGCPLHTPHTRLLPCTPPHP